MAVGKIKIVYRGIPINKFVGLKSKIYSLLSDNGKESNTAKGVNTAPEFNEFKDTLFNKKVLRHKLGTYEINKISLSAFDDKIFVLNDGIHTLAYYHKNIDSPR